MNKAEPPNSLRIEYLPLSALKCWPRNPKEHDLGALHSSLARFGYVNPMIVNEATGELLAGHGRLDALVQRKEIGEPLPERMQEKDGEWLVPVIRGISLPSEEAAAYAIADNRLVELGGWDDALLVDVLQELSQGAGLDGMGYDEDDLNRLLQDVKGYGTDDGPEAQIDRAEELQGQWQTARGQIWQIGKHRLMCGDATSKSDVARLMNGRKAVLMATDPPYGDAWIQKARDMASKGYGHSRAVLHGKIEGDDKTDTELAEFLGAFLAAAKVAGDPPFPTYVWHGAKRMLFEQALVDADYHVHQPIVWVKPSFVIGRLHYHPRCEWALHGWLKGGGACPFYGERNQSDVWELGRENDGLHPTQKPTELFAIPMRNHTKVGEIAYDPFLGSGTTMVAAEQLGRICYGMEIEPKYCAVTLQRMADIGLEPKLLEA